MDVRNRQKRPGQLAGWPTLYSQRALEPRLGRLEPGLTTLPTQRRRPRPRAESVDTDALETPGAGLAADCMLCQYTRQPASQSPCYLLQPMVSTPLSSIT